MNRGRSVGHEARSLMQIIMFLRLRDAAKGSEKQEAIIIIYIMKD